MIIRDVKLGLKHVHVARFDLIIDGVIVDSVAVEPDFVTFEVKYGSLKVWLKRPVVFKVPVSGLTAKISAVDGEGKEIMLWSVDAEEGNILQLWKPLPK